MGCRVLADIVGSDSPVFRAESKAVRAGRGLAVVLDRETLAAFGTFKVPTHVWEAMSRYACWIEPTIVNERCELMSSYDQRQGIERPMDDCRRALVWLDFEHDTARIRDRVREMIAGGHDVRCAWTGRRLPSAKLLHDSCDRILAWWQAGYGEWNVLERFRAEAFSSLPLAAMLAGGGRGDSDFWQSVFTGVDHQRVRLRMDQQLEEREG